MQSQARRTSIQLMATEPKDKADGARDSDKAKAIADARAEVDAGKTVPYERVRRWLLSWGSDKELPRPRCK